MKLHQLGELRIRELVVNTLKRADKSLFEMGLDDASAMKCKYAFRYLGYERLARKCDVELINLSEAESEPTEVKVGNESFKLSLIHI